MPTKTRAPRPETAAERAVNDYKPGLLDTNISDEVIQETAREAARRLQRMLPGLRSFARIMTRDPKVQVVMRHGIPSTDGRTIYLRPPIELGLKLKHGRRCGERDERSVLVCEACRTTEDVEVTLYHEVAHIAFGSFAALDDTDRRAVLQRCLRERCIGDDDDSRAKRLARRLEEANPRTYIAASRLISPYLKLVVNALEDARVNTEMFRSRPGTYKMFLAQNRQIFENGRQQADGAIANWREMPLNAQAIVGLFTKASGLDYASYFDARVVEALESPALGRICTSVATARSVRTIYTLAFAALEELRRLGFCRRPDDPEDASGDDSAGSDQASGNAAPEADGDSTGSESGSGAGDEAVAGDDSTRSDGEAGPDGCESNEATDQDEAEADGRSTGSDGGSGRDEPAAGEHAKADGVEPSDSGPAEEDETSRPGHLSPSDENDEPGGSAATNDAPPDGTPEEGDEVAGESHVDSDGRSDSLDAADDDEHLDWSDGDADQDEHDTYGDRADDESNVSGSASDVEDDSGGQADEVGDNDDSSADQADAGSDPGRDGDEAEDHSSDRDDGMPPGPADRRSEDVAEAQPSVFDDLGDPLADDDDAIRIHLPMGDPDEAEEALRIFGGHDEDGSVVPAEGSPFAEYDREALDREVDRAIIQGEHFDGTSLNIWGVNEHRWGCEVFSGSGYALTSNEIWPAVVSDTRRRPWGLDLEIDPQVLAPALARGRIVFADNRKAQYRRNLKAGKISSRVLGRRVPVDDPRLFARKVEPGTKDYFVLLGLDISGSTTSGKLAQIKAAALHMAELLNRLGVAFAVYGHSGSPANYGHRAHLDKAMNVDIVVIKDPTERWTSDTRERLLRVCPFLGNLDGHTLEYYRKVCHRQQATSKLVLYFTDGVMPCANYDEELEILQREIRDAPRRGIVVVGVGVGTDSPTRHGLDTLRLDDLADVPNLVRDLERRLTT